MKLDVVFATHNGAARLGKMLHAFCALEVPELLQLTIIAVDNASTDKTQKVLKKFSSRLPLKVLEQPTLGKNAALNLALVHSRGEFVIFTDDDIIPDRLWLRRWTEASQRYPDFDLFGGVIEPDWPRTPPRRLLAEIPVGPAFALTPNTLKTGPCEASVIWGNNMAVRKYVFAAGHRFDENVGPKGLDYIMGSETDFLSRCERGGHRAFFVDGARVKHMIREEQFSLGWLRARGHRFGRSVFRSEIRSGEHNCAAPELRGAPRWALRKQLGQRLKAAVPVRKNYAAAWQAGFYSGYIREYRSWSADEAQRESGEWQTYAK